MRRDNALKADEAVAKVRVVIALELYCAKLGMSAMGQKRTHSPQQKWARYSISSRPRRFPAAADIYVMHALAQTQGMGTGPA